MKMYNKKIEVTRIFKHFILEWENAELARSFKPSNVWPLEPKPSVQGTEVYNDKEELLKRIAALL